MKTLIVYDSKRGGTLEILNRLCTQLHHSTILLPMKEFSTIQSSDYDQLLFAAPTYAGNLRKSAVLFLQENIVRLKEKRLFLANTGIQWDPTKIEMQLSTVFPEELRQHASATLFIGGICLTNKMNIVEKMILKKIFSDNQLSLNLKTSHQQVHEENLNELLSLMNQ